MYNPIIIVVFCLLLDVFLKLYARALTSVYFFADKHDGNCCANKQPGAAGMCLACEMDFLFSQIFSG